MPTVNDLKPRTVNRFKKKTVIPPSELQDTINLLLQKYSSKDLCGYWQIGTSTLRNVRDGYPITPRALETVQGHVERMVGSASVSLAHAETLITLVEQWAEETKETMSREEVLEMLSLVSLAESMMLRAKEVLPTGHLRKRCDWLSLQLSQLGLNAA